MCFDHPIFHFWFLVTFGDEDTKIQKYYVILVYILQEKMGKMEKNRKDNYATYSKVSIIRPGCSRFLEFEKKIVLVV